jgi:hypothetical protein
LLSKDARAARDVHEKVCDYIPCTYQLREADFSDWLLMSELDGMETSDSMSASQLSRTSAESEGYKVTDDPSGGPTEALRPSEVSGECTQTSEGIRSSSSEDFELCCGICGDSPLDVVEELKESTCSGTSTASASAGNGREVVDSASMCFHDAESSYSSESSENEEIGSTQEMKEDVDDFSIVEEEADDTDTRHSCEALPFSVKQSTSEVESKLESQSETVDSDSDSDSIFD